MSRQAPSADRRDAQPFRSASRVSARTGCLAAGTCPPSPSSKTLVSLFSPATLALAAGRCEGADVEQRCWILFLFLFSSSLLSLSISSRVVPGHSAR